LKFKKLSKILNLELAWRRVQSDQYNDFVPDILELRDVDHDGTATLKNLRDKLDRGYEPSDLLEIDVPKKGYTLRPGSNMIPEDRIVYQAVVDFISSKVEEPPANACFSYRLSKKRYDRKMFQFWRPWWLKWRSKMRDVYDDGYRCLLKTDIAAYFEHIDQSILRTTILNGQVKDERLLDLLNNLLRKWAVSEARYIGIPQGCDASSYIGNLYLINLDKIMLREGFKYFRYSDQIYVLTKDEREARKAIQLITHKLRELHLNLQDAKTDIITKPEKVEQEIGTEEDDKIRDFDYTFERKPKTRKIEEPEEKIIMEYKKVTRNGKAKEVDVSKFTWCLNRLAEMRSDKAANFVLRRFSELPFLADLFFKYLQIFANRKCVKDKIVDFLSSQDNIYDWQEMWLLLTLSKAKKLDGKQLHVVRRIIRDKDRHWASRAAAIFTLGKLGDETDRLSLKSLYSDDDNLNVKRAIAVSVHSLPKAARNKFYSEIEKDSYSIKRLVKYLRQEHIETI
jgi:hypothetical protein